MSIPSYPRHVVLYDMHVHTCVSIKLMSLAHRGAAPAPSPPVPGREDSVFRQLLAGGGSPTVLLPPTCHQGAGWRGAAQARGALRPQRSLCGALRVILKQVPYLFPSGQVTAESPDFPRPPPAPPHGLHSLTDLPPRCPGWAAGPGSQATGTLIRGSRWPVPRVHPRHCRPGCSQSGAEEVSGSSGAGRAPGAQRWYIWASGSPGPADRTCLPC